MTIVFKIQRQDRDYFCAADDGPKFFVGRRVTYKTNVGLYNVFAGSKLQKLNFDAANYGPDFGFWAEFIAPTAGCEGQNFLTLNTYDRAAFTFGFGQFAAHVPNGDFVNYFRALLAMPEAQDYFPSLALIDGHINKIDGAAPVPIETASSTSKLMAYLNPGLSEIEDPEVIAAAKLIHWTANHREARLAQIRQMIATFKGFMKEATRRGLIDGRSADQCCVIADILHQGRGTWAEIASALRSSRPFDNLVAIGAPEWDGRKATLRRLIKANPNFAAKHWKASSGDFV